MVEGGPRLRIGFDAHSVGRGQTGNERYALELSRALACHAELDVIAYVDKGTAWPTDRQSRGEGHASGAADGQPALRRLRTSNRWLRLGAELPLRARQHRLDLLHVQFVPPPLARLPVATLVADLSFHDRPDLVPAATRARLKLTTGLAVRSSAAILIPSLFTRARLLARYDIDPQRVHVTPEGVSPAWAVSERVAPPLLPDGLPARYVLAVGAAQPRKNLPRLVAAVHGARCAGAGDLALVLVGPDGPGSVPLERAISAFGARSWVRRLGYQPDGVVAALYRGATAVAYASLYEGFGLPVLEAMAAGAPLVASSTTSIPELAADAALLVDPTDTAAISSAIGLVATDELLRQRLVAAGRQRAATFTWERCAQATLAAYRGALAS